jgi:hypothetical protein
MKTPAFDTQRGAK